MLDQKPPFFAIAFVASRLPRFSVVCDLSAGGITVENRVFNFKVKVVLFEMCWLKLLL